MDAGLNLDRNLLESIHDLLAAVSGFAVAQRHVRHSADWFFEHDLAIDHHDDRALVLQTAQIETNDLIGEQDAEALFATDGKIDFDPKPAVIADAERHGSPAAILRKLVRLVLETGISNRVFRDGPCRSD